MKQIMYSILLTGFIIPLLMLWMPMKAEATQKRVNCGSDNYGYSYCRIHIGDSVSLERQLSGKPCTFGRTWGFDHNGIWVDKGCRAIFIVEQHPRGRKQHDKKKYSPGRSQLSHVTCESKNYGYNHCQASTYGQVRIDRQLSSNTCALGQTWGTDSSGIWVDKGCRAVFVIEQNSKHKHGYTRFSADRLSDRSVICESNNSGYTYCRAATYGRLVTLTRKISKSNCVEGRSWGYDQSGIWVDKGCRAVFVISGTNYNNEYTAPYRPSSQYLSSDEATRAVKRAYRDILGRGAAQRELSYYRSKMMDDGWSERQVRDEIKRHRNSNQETDKGD